MKNEGWPKKYRNKKNLKWKLTQKVQIKEEFKMEQETPSQRKYPLNKNWRNYGQVLVDKIGRLNLRSLLEEGVKIHNKGQCSASQKHKTGMCSAS